MTSTITAPSSFTVGTDGMPVYRPASHLAASLCAGATTVELASGWEAEDGEEMTALLLRDASGTLIASLPAPAADEAWLAAFETSEVMAVHVRGHERHLQVVSTPR